VLWNHFKLGDCQTPQHYTTRIMEAYKKGTYASVDVIDVHAVVNYVDWLEPHHGVQERLHKMELTQLQMK
jgi:cytochrome c